MSHSLRCRLKNLRYKKILTDRELERLCKALDNEKVLEQIRAEIEHEMNRDIGGSATDFVSGRKCGMGEVLQIIDKYR